MDAFSSIVSIASILLAIWSMIQAKGATRIAKRVEKRIHENRQTSGLSKMTTCLDKEIKDLIIFSAAVPLEGLHGIDLQQKAKTIQDYITTLKTDPSLTSEDERKKADDICSEVEEMLAILVGKKYSLEQKKTAGKQIYDRLIDFSYYLKIVLRKQTGKS
jgi:hypothetical protein